MREKGLPAEAVLEELKRKLHGDFTFQSGRILGSMCTYPHRLARQVYAEFLEKNLGDPGLFPATAEIEREVIQTLGELLSNPHASGNIVTGGTEANVLALWAFKNLRMKNGGEIVVPVSAHCSFDKAASLLGFKIVRVGLNNGFQVDVEAARKAITPKTIALVGIAGTTGLGVVDPIDELSDLALEHNLLLHVDAAFGGFVLPFLKELGYKTPEFDFSLPGVSSITIDPHKMGLAPIPAGGILFRNEELRKAIAWKVPYLAGGEIEQSTFVGTRSGASVIAVWALLRHLGREGYRKIVERCMRVTWKLAEGVKQVDGLDILTKPVTNVVGIKSEDFDIKLIAEKLREKGWAVALFPRYIRIVLMPHIHESHVERFLEDLKRIVKELKG
jgi:tyrosine decarboxylase/aspartate 1-decarboxylase